MAESCSLYAQVRNKKGQEVDSKLFKSLLDFCENRAEAKRYYALSMDFRFKELTEGQAAFDENGEMTFRSFLKLSNLKLNRDKVLQQLNKQIKSGNYSYNDAIRMLQDFNRNSVWNDKYMATISYNREGNNYTLKVVPNSTVARDALKRTITRQNLQDRMIYSLESMGVKADFLKDGNTSRYSTENAMKTHDGFYHLIQVSQGQRVNENLAEECGHFAVAALGNSPLVERLEAALDTDTQKKVLGSDYDEKYLGKDSRREVAGTLVGRALLKEPDRRTAFGNLAYRVANLAKKVFARFSGDTVKMQQLQAEEAADKIAREFLSGEFNGTLENALSTPETLFNAKLSPAVQTYKAIVSKLKLSIAQFKAMNSNLADVYEGILEEVTAGNEAIVNGQQGTFADAAALGGIANTLNWLIDRMEADIAVKIDSVNLLDESDFRANLSRNGHLLRESHIALQNAYEIIEILNGVLNTYESKEDKIRQDVQYMDSTGTILNANIPKLRNALNELASTSNENSLFQNVITKEKQFYLRFLCDCYGQDYIERGTRVVFKDWKNLFKSGGHVLAIEGVSEDNRKISIKDALRYLEKDETLFDYWLGSMGNATDLICQINDMIMKNSNKTADDITNHYWDMLKGLQEELKGINGGNTDIFFERLYDGNLSGNFISEYNYGEWGKKLREEGREWRYNFRKAHALKDSEGNIMYKRDSHGNILKDKYGHELFAGFDYDDMSDFQKGQIWKAYIDSYRKQWHRENSIYDEDEQRWKPNELYRNHLYEELSIPEKEWLGKYLSLKNELDDMTGGAMPHWRVPQFKGSFMNRVQNRGSRLSPSNYAKGIWQATKETFCADSEDWQYGSDIQDYVDVEEDPFQDALDHDKSSINRLTLFGINRLPDMSQLSTDLFHSTLSYAAMASRYSIVGSIADSLEVGKYVLGERGVGLGKEKALGEHTKAYKRYCKFLDKQVYGVAQKPHITGKIVWNKVASFFSALGSKLYLGGNIAGGIVNTGTGFIEISKEAFAGQFFNGKEWRDANLLFFKSIPSNWFNIGSQTKTDKVSLFIRKFNVLNNNRERYRNWNTRRTRLSNFILEDGLMLPYSSGDYYMQSIAYLALAQRQKLYTRDGVRKTMWNAYSVDKIKSSDSQGNNRVYKGKTLYLDQMYFKSREDIDTYNELDALVDNIQNCINNNAKLENLTDWQQNYLTEHNYTVDDLGKLKYLLQNDMYKLTWNEDDESKFMDKAREINNRMHGIYNEQDKTVAHQNIVFNMLLAMRGYALGMIQRRFGAQKHSVALGSETEGSYRTALKVLMAPSLIEGSWLHKLGTVLKLTALPIFTPKKASKLYSEVFGKGNNVDYMMRNMRRNGADIMALILLALAKGLTGDDDDKDDVKYTETEQFKAQYEYMKNTYGNEYAKIWKKQMDSPNPQHEIDVEGMAYYFLSRWFREQGAENIPFYMKDEWASLSSLTPTGASIIWDLAQLGYYGVGATLYDYQEDTTDYDYLERIGYTKDQIHEIREAKKEEIKNAPGRQFYYQSSKKGSYEKGQSKFSRKLMMMTPYYRFQNVLYGPRQAAESYGFTRHILSE